jgi:hypothetical protein
MDNDIEVTLIFASEHRYSLFVNNDWRRKNPSQNLAGILFSLTLMPAINYELEELAIGSLWPLAPE